MEAQAIAAKRLGSLVAFFYFFTNWGKQKMQNYFLFSET